MIEAERIPGTRSDPEFTAIRSPAWEDPFTCRVLLPDGLAGLNDFLTADWWNARHGELASTRGDASNGLLAAGS